MKNFVVLYYAPAEATAGMANVTPEQAQEGMKPWMDWFAKVGDKLVDGGTPLLPGARITSAGTTSPNPEISGYTIIQAEDLDAAKKLLEGHPHFRMDPRAAIEVYEAMPMPGM